MRVITGILGRGYLGEFLINHLRDTRADYFYTKRQLSPPMPEKGYALDLINAETGIRLPEAPCEVIWTIPPITDDEEKEKALLDRFFSQHPECQKFWKKLVYISSTSVYPASGFFTESCNSVPDNAKGRMRIYYENYFKQRFKNLIILRPGGIYGPARNFLESASVSRQIPPDKMVSRIHVKDLSALCFKVLSDSNPPLLLNAVDHYPSSRMELFQWIQQYRDLNKPGEYSENFTISQPDHKSSRVISGDRLKHYMSLSYPTFREGYAEIMKTRFLE